MPPVHRPGSRRRSRSFALSWPGGPRTARARATVSFLSVALLIAAVQAVGPRGGDDLATGAAPGGPPPAAAAASPDLGLTASAVPWSSAETWGGKMPKRGADVTIPKDKDVVLDVSPPVLGTLRIEGSLTFADADLALKAEAILVKGTLRAGTARRPFTKRARIVLTGTNPQQDINDMGPKVLGVAGGTLELHGETRPGWTQLGATARPGNTRITLKETMPWRRGDRVVVSSTDFSAGQAEEFTLRSVDGRTLTLDRAVRYPHHGTLQTIAGRTLDERAEVALLSRNITIEGEKSSSDSGFGGQVFLTGTARLDGVEFTRMGQRNILRRYPVHFHMLGSAEGSYLRNSSLHHTFNRCVVVHGTNDLIVSGNVCHDHVGHGYFLEDGDETDNVFENNLGLTTRKPAKGQGLLPSDDDPATFWITNPDNTIRGNVAAGSEGHGFWVALPEHPTGLSKTSSVWPRRTPLKEFSANTAHSNARTGLNVDDGPKPDGTTEVTSYKPVAKPANAKSKPVEADFSSFTAYKNRDHGSWLRGSNLRMDKAVLADNGIGATFAADRTRLTNSFVVGESANTGTPAPYEEKGAGGRSLPKPYRADFPIRGFEFYDGPVGTESTTFANFTPNAQRQASGLGSKLDNPFPISTRNYAKGARFVDANRFYAPDPTPQRDGEAAAVFRDVDGSVSGSAGTVVAANSPFLHYGKCRPVGEWNAAVCTQEMLTIRVATLDGNPAAMKPLTLKRGDGVAQALHGTSPGATDAQMTVAAGLRYDVAFRGATPSRQSYVLREGKGRFIELSLAYPAAPKVTRYGCDVADPKAYCYGGNPRTLSALSSQKSSTYFYDAPAKRLYLRIAGKDSDYEELQVSPR